MKRRLPVLTIPFFLLVAFMLPADLSAFNKGSKNTTSGWVYKTKADHPGRDVTPTQALEMVQKDKYHTFIVDVRTKPEYAFVGHPTMAVHIPAKLWTGEFTEKKGKPGYGMVENKNFTRDLLGRFDTKRDTLIFMCRSGKRSCSCSNKAVAAGFPSKRVFNMLGGFEGDKISSSVSAYKGKRVLGGWKNEGLPWTYSLDTSLMYQVPK